MEIAFSEKEQEAIQIYADKHNLTYGQALQKLMEAMTKGLIELAVEDNEFNKNFSDNKPDLPNPSDLIR